MGEEGGEHLALGETVNPVLDSHGETAGPRVPSQEIVRHSSTTPSNCAMYAKKGSQAQLA